MTDGRLERLLRGFGDVRGREARAALALSAYFFLITAAFYIIKPVKESLLIGIHPAWWSYADLATALLIGFVVALNARLLDRLPRRTYLTASLLFFVASLLVFWLVFDMIRTSQVQTPVADSSGILFLLWAQTVILRAPLVPVIVFSFWADVFIAMAVTQFWIAVNDVLHAHQAKRLVGLFVTGGLVGGIAGAAIAFLATTLKAVKVETLLLVCPVLLLLALVTVNFVYAGRQRIDAAAGDGRIGPAAGAGAPAGFGQVLRHRYLRLLAAMLASAILAGTLINYQFKTAVKSAYPGDQARTSYIAGFLLVILAVSTVFHLLTTDRFLKTYGIRWAISLAPLALLLGSAAVFVIPAVLALPWASLVRGADKGFDNTLSQSVRELLYIPVPADVKYRAKIFIDMFVSKFATGCGALVFLGLRAVRNFDYRAGQDLAILREIGVLTVAAVLVWLVLTRLVYREYPAVLKQPIRRKWTPADEVIREHVDEDLTLKVFNTIQSRERSTTLYLMNIFDLVRRRDLTPDLRGLLGLKRDEIKARGMDALFDVGGAAFFPGLEEAVDDPAFRREIELVFLLPVYQEIMAQRLGEMAASPAELDRIEVAKLIGRMVPNPPTIEALGRLLRDPSAEVALYALESAAVHRHPGHVPLILDQLANPMLRAAAQTALAAYGPGVAALVAPALASDGTPVEIRRALPEVLARLGTQTAADILLDGLGRRDEALEQALVDALAKIRLDRPEIRFSHKAVRLELLGLVRRTCEIVLDPPAGPPAEARALLDIRLKRVFDLLTLLYPPEDIVKAYQNILQGTAQSTDYSLEHLDMLLDRELKGLLLPLVDAGLSPEERAQRLRRALRLK
ncbi:MAG TPA: Npt1/Npt2 family nucleotide transporter [Candidatus Aminicenantes bacterium]|nr:Npt1/Npt2 family nucleotide transporter [Candidatus Aminicenantes bacterium]HRY65650.1 Npt1/Npt2 family nucleotide transporter [Candidatus Aminicenantes bacterium]HRZ72462.1 Npt1/Npt2 family nucleotide transporter [Candidatus Aminicenantes bacterium]